MKNLGKTKRNLRKTKKTLRKTCRKTKKNAIVGPLTVFKYQLRTSRYNFSAITAKWS
jgi:hypothetical protein